MRVRRGWALALPVVIVMSAAGAAGAAPADGATIPLGTCAKPAGVTTDAEGDKVYEFRFPTGLTERHPVPAPDFDPATASPERLRKLGLPDRPATGAAGRADWNRLAASLQRRTTPRPGCFRTNAKAIYHTYNYSGYRAIAASGKTYSGIHASYTAPSYYLSTCGSESMTQWVGVSNDTLLAQVGLYVTQYNPTVWSSAFYEFVRGGDWETPGVVDVDGVPYIAGHRYYFSALYVDRFNWQFIINDLTSGALASFYVQHVNGGATQFIQPLGYFVSERLTYGDVLTEYMNHSDVRFRSAMVRINGAGDARMSIQRPEQVIMHSRLTDERLGNVDTVNESDSSFTEHFARCGFVE